MFKFPCPHCGHRLKAEEAHVGHRVRCSHCTQTLIVPAPQPPTAQAIPVARPVPPVPGVPVAKAVPTATAVPVAKVAAVSEARPMDVEPIEPVTFVRRGAAESDEMDMTPMIDVVFQLLIFFMLTAAMGLQKSIAMPPSDVHRTAGRTVEEMEQDPSYVIVRVEGDNTIWVDDALAPSRQELLSKLRESRETADGRSPANRLLVLAAGDARHERVVMVLDAGTAVGMEDIRLATHDE